MADPIKGATFAPKELEPHPLDAPGAAEAAQLTETYRQHINVTPGKRAEETRAGRRRRADTIGEYTAPLSVDESKLDPNYAHRWINDTRGRLHKLTVEDDWDVIKSPTRLDEKTNEGMPERQIVGANPDGSPIHAYLCRKPKQFFDEDRAKKLRRSKELEDAVMRGQSKDTQALSTSQSTTYIPGGSNSIETMTGTKVTTYKP